MNDKINTFTLLNKTLYIAETPKLMEDCMRFKAWLSAEELSVLNKRKHKQKEFLYSRYIIKKASGLNKEQATSNTVKYDEVTKVAGIFDQQKLLQRLSLSHSGNFLAFSFCSPKERLGVDIEVVTSRKVDAIIAEYFCEKDQQLLKGYSDNIKGFYKLWTEKEAITKLVGASIFTLISQSSSELNKKYQLASTIQNDFIASIALDIRPQAKTT